MILYPVIRIIMEFQYPSIVFFEYILNICSRCNKQTTFSEQDYLFPCYRLLLLFVDNLCNSLDPDQDQKNAGPHLDPNHLTLWHCSWKNFMKKLILKKSTDDQKNNEKLPSMQRVKVLAVNWLSIGVAPITQLCKCIIKIVAFKGGHLMW